MLREAKACGVYTKSSIMLGLGETDAEIIDTLLDLRGCGSVPLVCRAVHCLLQRMLLMLQLRVCIECAVATPVTLLGCPALSLQSHV